MFFTFLPRYVACTVAQHFSERYWSCDAAVVSVNKEILYASKRFHRVETPTKCCSACVVLTINTMQNTRSAFYRRLSLFFFSQNPDQHMFTFPSGYGQFALGVFDDRFDFGAGLGPEDNRDAENRRERETASRQRYGARQPRSRHGSRRQAGRPEGVPTLEG